MELDRNKAYFGWVDVAKAASIFGVVCIHSSIAEQETSLLLGGSSYFRFCVPVFIVISFFLSENHWQKKEGNPSKKEYLTNRLPRLLFPYIVWSILYALGQFYLGITPKINFGLTFAWQGQYFFVILIQLTILYPWLRMIRVTKLGLLFLALVTMIVLYLPSNYLGLNIPFVFSGEAPFFYWLFYVFLGIFMARNKNTIDDGLQLIPPSLATLLVVALPFLIIIEGFFAHAPYPYLRISVLLTSSILIILFTRIRTYSKPFEWVIRVLSKYSLGIFCMNPIIIASIVKVTGYLGLNKIVFSQLPAFASGLMIASVTCVLAVLTCSLIERIKCGLLVR
jgi:surface polysaccharide O-acyltransferase-like enzyme